MSILIYFTFFSGVITTQLDVFTNKVFWKHFTSIRYEIPEAYSNPWSTVYTENLNKCNLKGSNRFDRDCTSESQNHPVPPQSKRSIYVTNSVYALAKSFDGMLMHSGFNLRSCLNTTSSEFYTKVSTYLNEMKTTPPGGEEIRFHERAVNIRSTVLNVQKNPTGHSRIVEVWLSWVIS